MPMKRGALDPDFIRERKLIRIFKPLAVEEQRFWITTIAQRFPGAFPGIQPALVQSQNPLIPESFVPNWQVGQVILATFNPLTSRQREHAVLMLFQALPGAFPEMAVGFVPSPQSSTENAA